MWRISKWKEKKSKKILPFRSGDLNPRFSVIFPPMIWIFMESEEPEIKSKQASKADRTLCFCSKRIREHSEGFMTWTFGYIFHLFLLNNSYKYLSISNKLEMTHVFIWKQMRFFNNWKWKGTLVDYITVRPSYIFAISVLLCSICTCNIYIIFIHSTFKIILFTVDILLFTLWDMNATCVLD